MLVKSLIALFAMEQVSAWFGTGHLLVSRIAQDVLTDTQPDVLVNALKVLQVLHDHDPYWVKKEKNHMFTECTTFADDIKHSGGGYQSGWHFID